MRLKASGRGRALPKLLLVSIPACPPVKSKAATPSCSSAAHIKGADRRSPNETIRSLVRLDNSRSKKIPLTVCSKLENIELNLAKPSWLVANMLAVSRWRFLITAISALAKSISPCSAVLAIFNNWSVTPLMALGTTTTTSPFLTLCATKLALCLIACVEPISVPPNFITIFMGNSYLTFARLMS